MSRTLLVTIHMTLAAFFAPFVFLVAISGGLYLIGVKGELTQPTWPNRWMEWGGPTRQTTSTPKR